MRSKTAHLEPHTDFPWSREDYEELVRSGVFTAEDHIELLNGKLITMAPQYASHTTACLLVANYLVDVFRENHVVRSQFPLALDDRSEPEPDLAVVRGRLRDYSDHHPSASDTVLLVEVSDSSLDYDRTDKLAAYARGGIPEYWILNLVDRVLEVYRKPAGDSYGEKRTLGADDPVAPLGCEDQAVSVADLLP